MKFSPESLQARRINLGLSQRQLAAAAGVSGEAIRVLELGRHAPQMKTLKRIADALGCDPLDLVSTSQQEPVA